MAATTPPPAAPVSRHSGAASSRDMISDELRQRLEKQHRQQERSELVGLARYHGESRGYWRGLGIGFLLGLVLGVFATVARLN